MEKVELEKIVKRAILNDEEAFNQLFLHFYPSIYKTAFKLCHNDADAKDIAQLTFLQMRKSLHTLEKPDYFPLWLHRICVNKCKNLFRDNHADSFDDEYYTISNRVIEQRMDYNSDKRMRFLTDRQVLLALMNELKPEHLEVLEMTYFRQMSIEEIALLLKIPTGTVKSRLFAARNSLREKINAYEKKEGISLDFHAEGIGSILMMMYLSQQQQLAAKGNVTNKKFPASMKTKAGRKMLIRASVPVLACLGGVLLYNTMKPTTISQSKVAEHQHPFPTLYIEDYVIDNAQDGYYYLRGRAFDRKAMEQVSMESLKELMPLYLAMKEHGHVYYETLVESGWSKAYETITSLK